MHIKFSVCAIAIIIQDHPCILKIIQHTLKKKMQCHQRTSVKIILHHLEREGRERHMQNPITYGRVHLQSTKISTRRWGNPVTPTIEVEKLCYRHY